MLDGVGAVADEYPIPVLLDVGLAAFFFGISTLARLPNTLRWLKSYCFLVHASSRINSPLGLFIGSLFCR